VALKSAPNESEICTSVDSVPSTDLVAITNQLYANFLPLSGGLMTGNNVFLTSGSYTTA
jgi:hypothetical protein